jgi:hypothetical protein
LGIASRFLWGKKKGNTAACYKKSTTSQFMSKVKHMNYWKQLLLDCSFCFLEESSTGAAAAAAAAGLLIVLSSFL